MAYIFGDGFDLYTAVADAYAGYWDGGTASSATLIAGRFTGGQAVSVNTGATLYFIKNSPANDAVHHIVIAFRQTAALTGSTLGVYLQLLDGTNGQCAIVFRSDGAILLTSGTPGGTILDTYPGAVSAQNTWTAFEIEVVINNTTGSWAVRKNGNTSNDRALGSLNTRPVSANNYANKLQVGFQGGSINAQQFDDLLWRSDASSVPWVGDIRTYIRMPASDASVQFARAPNPASVSQTTGQLGTNSKAANAGHMSAFVATYTGTISSASVLISTGGTGNMKAAIYDATRTTVLATSNAVVNPSTGSNTVTFGTPLSVTKGTTYYLAFDQDTTLVYNVTGSNQYTFTTTYASFPATGPVTTTGSGPVFTVAIAPTINNEMVSEAQQDGATSYVYDSTVGHADLYTIAALGSTPASVVAVTTRGFLQKSDAGTRNGAVQLKSGATTVNSGSVALSSSWGWMFRTDVNDPATGSAWTPVAVNNAQIGPTVTA